MFYDTLLYEADDPIGVIRLNRPEVLNAMNAQFWQEFEMILGQLEKDDSVKVVIITGNGRAFSTGADLKESRDRSEGDYKAYLKRLQKVSMTLMNFEKPVIAAINGYAIGSGYELALACDIRIAAKNAVIGSPEAKVSSSVTGGAFKLLYDLIGPSKAKELLFTGKNIDGEKAFEIGLVNAVVPLENLMDTTLEMAKAIAENADISLAMIKKGFCMVQSGVSLPEIMDFEVNACLKCVTASSRQKALSHFENRKKR